MIIDVFDNNKKAILNPDMTKTYDSSFPKVGVTCFSKKIIDNYINNNKVEEIEYLTNANGKRPIYKINYNGTEIALYMSCVGAAGCVADLEEIFELGVEKVVVFGTCGCLDKNIEDLAIIIPTSAVRDEGTSYHYEKASNEILTNIKYKEEFIDILAKHGISYTLGKTWTTDAIYRETKNNVMKRKEEGCICVDMEASAISAVAKFRNKEVFQFFYAADNLDTNEWDKRSLSCDAKLDEKCEILYIALEQAKKISEN